MGRAPCCDKANVKKGPWSPEEDAKLKAYIEQHGTGGNWIALPHKIGLKRCGKSCRLRWLNYLRPNIKHGGFSEEEDNIICSLYISIGSRWSIIAAQLPGRTDNDIKNYWNTRLKKKLLGKQRKEQQAQARRLTSLKQEIKSTLQPSNKMMDMNMNQTSITPTPSWSPHHQLSPSASIQEPYYLNNLRNLLTKLGGTFSPHHHYHHQLPYPHHHTHTASSFPQPQEHRHHQYPMNNIICATSDQLVSSSNNMFEGFQNLGNDDLSVNPQQMEGAVLESDYYGIMESNNMDMSHVTNGSSTTTTTSTESSSWGDMSMTSLLYSPTLVPEYQAATGIMPLHVAFEESSYFGSCNHNSVYGVV